MRFSRGKVVVDAHWEPERFPDGVDAWRLMQYLDALGIRTLSLDGTEYAAEEETELYRMLVRLSDQGFLAFPEHRDVFRPLGSAVG